jgi:K+-sensing histidine kinase KdpD
MKMLVCVSAKQHTTDVVGFACRLAAESASEVITLHVQPGPWSHSKGYLAHRDKEEITAALEAFPDHLGVLCRSLPHHERQGS